MYLRGMSDWSLAELEDIDWGVFGRTDDHIVPRRGGQFLDESSAPSVAHNKPQLEVKNDVGKNMCTKGSTKTVLWEEEDVYHLPMKNGNSSILEGSQAHTSNIAVPTLCGLERTANGTALPSQGGRILDYCVSDSNTDEKSSMFCSTDPSVGTSVSTNSGKSCLSSYKNVTPDVTYLSSTERQQKDRDNELAYSDWPDIGNFEDIDKLLRNWDTTIGPGETGTADELSWFSSSSNAISRSDNAFEPGFKCSNSDRGVLHDKLGSHYTNPKFLPKNVPAATDHDKPTYSKYAGRLGTDAPSADKSVAKEQSCNGEDEKKNIKLTQITNECSLIQSGASEIASHPLPVNRRTKRSTDQMLLDSDFSAPKIYSSDQFSQQKHFANSSASSFMQNQDPHSDLEFGFPTHQVPLAQITANVGFDKGGNPSSSYKVLDHIVNHSAQFLERFPGQLYMPQVRTSHGNIDNLYQRQQLSSTMTIEHPHQQPAFRSKASVHDKVLETRDDTEMEEVGLELPTVAIDHPAIEDGSGMASVSSDDSSEKVTCFRHLQDVMHQLDVKTKLCIRDSLYRLARSASQRNGFTMQNCGQRTTDGKGIQDTEASKRSAELMHAETNTNPIDRSIAHLLFHKPSELTTMLDDDSTTLESHIMNGQVLVPKQHYDRQMIFGACGDMETDLP